MIGYKYRSGRGPRSANGDCIFERDIETFVNSNAFIQQTLITKASRQLPENREWHFAMRFGLQPLIGNSVYEYYREICRF